MSDYYLYDASFLRVKTIQLGYTIPKNLIPKVRIRAYCNLENFFTITSYPGMDPEMDGDVGYPILKTVSFGLATVDTKASPSRVTVIQTVAFIPS